MMTRKLELTAGPWKDPSGRKLPIARRKKPADQFTLGWLAAAAVLARREEDTFTEELLRAQGITTLAELDAVYGLEQYDRDALATAILRFPADGSEGSTIGDCRKAKEVSKVKLSRRPKPIEPYVAARVDLSLTLWVKLTDDMGLYDAMEHAREIVKLQPNPDGPEICKGGEEIRGKMMTQREVNKWNQRVEREEKEHA